MPKKKGRGKIVRTRTKKIPGHPDEYLICDIYEKSGPQGGKTVCHKKKKKKSK